MSGSNHFGWVDYITVAFSILFSLFIGLYYGFCAKQTKEDLLMGGRSMKSIPVAISMIVTYFSATAILGNPAEVYAYGTQFFFLIILCLIFIPLSILIFVKVFYEMELTSIYQYLELRFESKVVRWLTSFTFILQILLMNSITLFAPAIALEAILGMPVWLSITGIGIIGTVYTSIGGLKAVIWTDVFQFVMILIGMGAIVIKGFIKAGGIAEAFSKANEKDRLQIFDWSVDPYERQNTLNYVLGMGFTILSLYGTHQPMVQRYCSLPSAKEAVKTLMYTIPLNVLVYTATIITGISAVATYAGCCPILLGKIHRPDAIIPQFVIEELSFLPGMMGIFVSCIFSAVLSSISSTLNSLAAVTWEDFVVKIPYFKNMKPEKQANWTKIIAAAYGALSIGLAFGAQNLGTIFQIMLTAIGATSGPLGGIFLCALFLPFMNGWGAICGIACGLGTMMFLAIQSFHISMKHVLYPRLPTDLLDCPADTDFSHATNYTMPPIPEFEYPEKLYTLSYLLYAFCGASIVVTVGVLVSICTGGCSKKQKVEERFIHPWIRNAKCVQRFIKPSTNKVTREPYQTELMSNPSFKLRNRGLESPQEVWTPKDKGYPYKYDLIDNEKSPSINNNNNIEEKE